METNYVQNIKRAIQDTFFQKLHCKPAKTRDTDEQNKNP
jgi:hypothetical protein